jgi:hypothetical protein
MADPQPGDQEGKRDLGRVHLPAEHAFAEESAAERDPVNAANQPIPFPHLNRVGEAKVEQGQHGLFDRPVDPGFGAIGAAEQDRVKGLVGGDPVAP